MHYLLCRPNIVNKGLLIYVIIVHSPIFGVTTVLKGKRQQQQKISYQIINFPLSHVMRLATSLLTLYVITS